MMSMLSVAKLIYRKDLAIERRSRETLFTVLSFGLLATLVFSLSFFIENDVSGAYAPGVIWIVVLFASTLGLQRLFESERENDCFGGLLLAPIDLRGVYIGKLFVQLTFSGLMEICTIPLIFLFFDLFSLVDAARVWTLLVLLALGTLGFAIIGTLFAAMLLSTRLRDVLLPIVVYPLVTPVIIAGVQGTRSLFMGVESTTHWISLIGAFDLIYLGLALAIFPKMLRA